MAERGEVVGNVVYGYVNVSTASNTPTTPRRTCTCKAAIKRVHNEPHVEVLPAHLPPG